MAVGFRAMKNAPAVEVICYSGFKRDERPLRFRLGVRWHEVGEILDRWYGPADDYFKVRDGDGDLYIRRRARSGCRSLESYRRGPDHPPL